MKNVGDLKHSALSEWTVLLSKWFQAVTVAGEKRVYCSVWHCVVSVIVSDVRFVFAGFLDLQSVDLLALNRRPCISVRVGVVEGGAAVTAQLAYLKTESAKSTVR